MSVRALALLFICLLCGCFFLPACLPMRPIHRFALVCFPSCATRFDGTVFCDGGVFLTFVGLGQRVFWGSFFQQKVALFPFLCLLHLGVPGSSILLVQGHHQHFHYGMVSIFLGRGELFLFLSYAAARRRHGRGRRLR
jgi:hypothetical protein